MKITRILAYRVELPLHETTYKWSGGKSVTVFDSTIVRVQTGTAGEVVRHAQSAEKQLITSLDVFDVYQGQGVGEGKKSVAIEATLQPREALKDEQIQQVMERIVAAVAKGTGGVLRG